MVCNFALLALVAIMMSLASAQSRCGEVCTFYFCKADGKRTVFDQVGPRLLLRDPNVATNPFVCRKIGGGINQGVKVVKTGEAMVHAAVDRTKSPPPFVKISQYSPPGLSPKYPKKYFTLKSIGFPPIPGEKGISRSSSSGNQNKFADDLCVKIPIKKYNLLKNDGSIDRQVKSKAPEDCVSFRSVVPRILVELTWDSSDDFDVSVTEPNGNKISFLKTTSPTGGKLNLDQNVDRCGQDPDGREQIRWLLDSNPLSGMYEVEVKHNRKCNNAATRWTLAVIIDGKLNLIKRGRSRKGKNMSVLKTKFNYSS